MRPLWRGAITFGLISIPVRLYSAVENKNLKFNLLHEKDGGRIKYQRTCAKCGEEVTWDDIVKGYEYSKDHYVTFTPEEMAALDVDSIKAVDVVSFVPLEKVDPIYFDKSYYVAPHELPPAGVHARGPEGPQSRPKLPPGTGASGHDPAQGRSLRSRDHALA